MEGRTSGLAATATWRFAFVRPLKALREALRLVRQGERDEALQTLTTACRDIAAGQELVPSHWPGFWTGVTYSWNGRKYSLSRLDSVALKRGRITSVLDALGEAENFYYGWGRGVDVRLGVRAAPGGLLHVRWTLEARHDMAVVPATDKPATPAGKVSMSSIGFFPEFIAPIFERAVWRGGDGTVRTADVCTAADTTYVDGPATPGGWCALFSRERGIVFGLIRRDCDEGAHAELRAWDATGWPSNVLALRMRGTPRTNWKRGETHTWSYTLVAVPVQDEAAAIAAMHDAAAAQAQQPRVEITAPAR